MASKKIARPNEATSSVYSRSMAPSPPRLSDVSELSSVLMTVSVLTTRTGITFWNRAARALDTRLIVSGCPSVLSRKEYIAALPEFCAMKSRLRMKSESWDEVGK